MKDFWKFYGALCGFSILLFIAAFILYLVTFQDPMLESREVSRILKTLDGLYVHQAENDEKRTVIMNELIHERQLDFSRVMSERAAEALILAGVMIIIVEGLTHYDASKRAQQDKEEISRNVWNAIFDRLVPEEIGAEIQRILKSDICRINPRYVVTLAHNPYSDLPSDHIIVKRELSYRLHNLTGGETQYPITIRVLSHAGEFTLADPNGAAINLPRITAVRIGKEEISLTASQRVFFSEVKMLPRMDTDEDAWEIYSEVEEVYTTNDRALYVLTAPCYELELQVLNQIPHLVKLQTENTYLTIDRDRLKKIAPDRWRAQGGILSGTALSLSWEPAAKTALVKIDNENHLVKSVS
jgi:hypothetical protein